MLKTLMAGALVLAVALPLKAQVGPGLGSTDHRGNVAFTSSQENYARVCTNQGNGRLSLRNGPGQGFTKIKEIPNGHALLLLDGKYDSQGFYWWKVVHNSNQGWVRADYVCDDPQ